MNSLMQSLHHTKILITGATGLIGTALVRAVLDNTQDTVVFALVRNIEKAQKLFSDCGQNRLHFLVSDIAELKPENFGIEYIIHAASQTASKAFVDCPVETINTAFKGTAAVLEFARANPVKSFVYLSSMEVYGTPLTDEKISETHATNLDTMQVRTCYPESKRMCENLCVSYQSEYAVPVRIVRLTQTFGEGVSYYDGRVFAEFARCAIEGRNIILKTKGETKRCYLSLSDAVSAVFTVLLKGQNGNAYNAANESTYCSIYEMAELVAETCASGKIKVVIEEQQDISKFGYAPVLKMNLSTEKLRALGWEAEISLQKMFRIMIADMKKSRISE